MPMKPEEKEKQSPEVGSKAELKTAPLAVEPEPAQTPLVAAPAAEPIGGQPSNEATKQTKQPNLPTGMDVTSDTDLSFVDGAHNEQDTTSQPAPVVESLSKVESPPSAEAVASALAAAKKSNADETPVGTSLKEASADGSDANVPPTETPVKNSAPAEQKTPKPAKQQTIPIGVISLAVLICFGLIACAVMVYAKH